MTDALSLGARNARGSRHFHEKLNSVWEEFVPLSGATLELGVCDDLCSDRSRDSRLVLRCG